MTAKSWELLESKKVFDSPYVEVFQDKLKKGNGETIDDFYSIKRKSWVAIAALTNENSLPLISQYKNGIKDVIWSLPAGLVDKDEAPIKAAERELLEETGFTSDSFIDFGMFAASPGGITEKAGLYLAKNARKVAEQKLDSDEEIEVKLFALDELVNGIYKRNGFLIDSHTILTLLLTKEAISHE